MPELTEQPTPKDVRCPECGAIATDESVRDHRLYATGYLHDDVRFECPECATGWTHGIAVGSIADDDSPPVDPDDMLCSSCGEQVRVHRVQPTPDDDRFDVLLHTKCPACNLFEFVGRDTGPNGVALVGHPDITGSTEGASPSGYPDTESAP
jgi:predicted RNA-binding Zn-ribbon protein involved in translation (DUF1610 family)